MKKAWNTRLAALFCACALLLGCVQFPAGATETDFIFLALNDQMVYPISSVTMPISISGTIYVPYYIFDYNYMSRLGVETDLGIRVAADSNTVTLYNKRRSLIYDLNAGTCVDSKTGVSYPRAIVRGGITYLQANSVCNFFMEDGLDYFYIGTQYGPIIRIVTPSVILDKDRFQDAATLGIPDAIRDYNKSQNPGPSASPSPSPTVSPSPSPSAGEPETPNKSGVSVFLAFQCSGGEGLSALLDLLEREELPALLFFRPEALAENEVLVRRAVGAGHAVGLTVGGGPAGDAKAALDEGNRLLELIAHTTTRIVTMEQADSAAAQALDEAGWSVWNANVSASGGSGSSYSAALLKGIDAKRALARVEMDDSARSSAALSILLRELRAQQYTLRLAVGSNIM